MSIKNITRRDFIKSSVSATVAVSLGSQLKCSSTNQFDPKGLPTRKFGNTGIEIPLIVIGAGSRFLAVDDETKQHEILNYALDHGLYYWDTASSYSKDGTFSEEILGKILKNRRKEVFLSTKIHDRTADGAKRLIEQSLERLQTDHLDLCQIHLIESIEDAEKLGAPDGVYNVLRQYKEQDVFRFIGFTGHLSAEGMKRAAEKYDFDTMLIALNHYQKGKEKFEEAAVPFAGKKGMGVLAMKVIRPRETVENLLATDLIKYALSLDHVSAAVIGIDNIDVLKTNIDLIKNFEPLSSGEMEKMEMALKPFHNSKNLAWMQHGYQDGVLV
jgi:uncharacterized protein